MNQHLNRRVKSLQNFDYYSGKLSNDTLNKVKDLCQEYHNAPNSKSYNNNLAGFIQDEYLLTDEIKNLVMPHIYEGACALFEQPLMKWKLESGWVNYQKKYEINPLHNHSGLMSFVMWINIPYNLDEELNLPYVKDSTIKKSATAFTFVYNDIHGRLAQEPFRIDKRGEGKFVVFHSQLYHMVYPFYTSDGYRISIAGNIEPTR
tara:strand:+ start:249 stop:860 length:612 start_codon:yes stop_codon:yes gene_type:complete